MHIKHGGTRTPKADAKNSTLLELARGRMGNTPYIDSGMAAKLWDGLHFAVMQAASRTAVVCCRSAQIGSFIEAREWNEFVRNFPQGLNRLRKQTEQHENAGEKHPSGAEALSYFESLAARLKSCPFKT